MALIWRALPLAWKAGSIIAALAFVASLYGVWHYRVAHAAKEAALAQVEKEKSDAIETGLAARRRIADLCKRDPVGCVRDEWLRD